jgi:hypothetical protein
VIYGSSATGDLLGNVNLSEFVLAMTKGNVVQRLVWITTIKIKSTLKSSVF